MQNIVVFLNGSRGLQVLKALVGAGHGVDLAVASESRSVSPEIIAAVHRCEVRLQTSADVNGLDFLELLTSLRPRLLVAAGFPTIFRRPLIEIAEEGCLNLHGGPLPRYRGGSPLNWQIINGETMAGISIIDMDEGIDTGDVLAEAEFPIGPEDTIADLHAHANTLFPELLLRVIAGLETGEITRRTQDPTKAVYWHQRNDNDGMIDWCNMTATEVHNLVRALTRPYPGAFTCWNNSRARIFSTSLPTQSIRGVPGRVCYIGGQGPYVVCRDRAVLIKEYEVEGEGRAKLSHGFHLV